MKSLKEVQAEVVDDFSMYDEWLDKYEYLIDLGHRLEAFPEELKTEDRLIKGCQSRVWLDATVEGDRLFFRADSDAIITKGIISLLIGVDRGRRLLVRRPAGPARESLPDARQRPRLDDRDDPSDGTKSRVEWHRKKF